LAALAMAFSIGAASAQQTVLDRTEAFDASYAVSFYTFDACGDGLHGRMFRQALTERFNQCPFTAPAKALFLRHSAFQRARFNLTMEHIIDEQGGLPLKLEGMTMTCHEQQALPEYVSLQKKLELFSSGQLKAVEIVPAECDSTSVTP
jgi:hypothetical protein